MKIPALMTCLLAMLLAALPLHRAHADEVNFDVFYNSLADDGDWYNTPEYGYVWQPFVAYKTDKWRPYSDGYWAQTDDGWTWVSYENFGWATYHYGRWTRLKDTGWVWVPGYDWGPGWVSWRTNDDYVGWAPLPPKVEEGVYEGRVVDSHRQQAEQIDYNDVEPEEAGYGSNVDVQYDIGPANYCFVETRNFGAPVLGEVLLPPQQNFVFIERTRNVTNIYYRRDHDRTRVYNNGPDFGFINSHVERPIPRLTLERRDDPVFLRDGLRGGGNPTQVRNGVLQVASPNIARRPVNFTQVKPTRIKQTLTQPQVARGWTGPGGDQAAGQRIREQYKQQAAAAPARPANPVIPPPVPERERAERAEHAAASTPPAPNGGQPFTSGGQGNPASGNPHAPLTEADRIARRDARQKEREQRAGGKPPTASGTPTAAELNAELAKDAQREAGKPAPRPNGQPAAAPQNPAAQGNTEQDKEARRAARQAARANGQPAAPAAPADAAQPKAAQDRDARRAAHQPAPEAQPQPQANNAQADQEREARRAARQQERASQPAASETQPAQQAQQDQEARRAARQQERASQPAPQQAPQQVQQEQEARRAARQQERAAQPAPQQAPQAQAQQEQEARRAARQQERAAQPERQPQAAAPERVPRQEQAHPNVKPGQTPTP